MERPQVVPVHGEHPVHRGLPFIGSLLEARHDPLAMFVRAAGLGDVVELRFPTVRAFHLAHPDHVAHVLHESSRNYVKQTRGYAALRSVLGNGLVTSDGSFWLRQRRLAQPAFHRERIAAFGERMVSAATETLARWEPAIATHTPVDLHDEMMHVTLRVVGDTLLSTDLTSVTRQVKEPLDRVLRELTHRTTRPFALPEWLPLPSQRAWRRDVRSLDGVVHGIIAKRRDISRSSTSSGDDLLGMFMDARDADTGERMNDAQLRDEIMTILLAGHETTANALSWAFWLLGQHPHVEARLRDELGRVLGSRLPTANDAPQLAYTGAVVSEALRLYPPVWVIARAALDGDVIGGVAIPKGAFLFMSPFVIHRRAELFPRPETFEPERWLDRAWVSSLPRCAYFPFSSGPRKCIGDGFAMLEAQLLLATLVQRVKVTLLRERPVRPDPVFTLRPSPGVWATLTHVPTSSH